MGPVLVIAGTAGAAHAQWKGLAPGVELHEKTYGGPNRVKALRIDLCAAGVHIRATAPSERGQRTSAWASKVGVVAAVNGGFFRSPTQLDGGFAWGNGQFWAGSSDDGGRGYFGFGPNQLEFSASGLIVG